MGVNTAGMTLEQVRDLLLPGLNVIVQQRAGELTGLIMEIRLTGIPVQPLMVVGHLPGVEPLAFAVSQRDIDDNCLVERFRPCVTALLDALETSERANHDKEDENDSGRSVGYRPFGENR